MKTAIAHLVGSSPYSQSRPYSEEVPELSKESKDDYERRTWRHRMHTDASGHVVIPGQCFANSLKIAAKRARERIKGKGHSEWGKVFEAGIMVTDGLTLPLKADDVPNDKLYLNADGKPGSGTRVWRYMPRIDSWSGPVTFYVLDDQITEDVFSKFLRAAGLLVGIGRFRPENRGFYGRFDVQRVEWRDDMASAAE